MTERAIMHSIMRAVSGLGARLFRNNVGVLQDRHGNYITYGVCNPGGSDLIGWTLVRVQPEHVGKTFAVFTAVEVKDGAKMTDAQRRFLTVVNESGGIGVEASDARTVEIAILARR